MSDNKFRLIVRWNKGSVNIDSNGSEKLSDLKKKIAASTNIPYDKINAFRIDPRRQLNLDDDQAELKDSDIPWGGVLYVEQKSDDNCIANNEPAKSHIVNSDKMSNEYGVFKKKIVPADNSCLFTSIGFVLNGKVDSSCSLFMREIIANAVAADPEVFSDAVLDRPNAEYCDWICKKNSWGGAIEISILAKFYGIEIAVVDSLNAIVNKFGEDMSYSQRAFLVFDGLHYDPLYMESEDGQTIQTIFPSSDEKVLKMAEELALELKNACAFTDIKKFKLKCLQCNECFSGSGAAKDHCKNTGHINFTEVNA